MTPTIDANAADTTTTTPLLNRFLLLAVLWMAMAAFAAMADEADFFFDIVCIQNQHTAGTDTFGDR